VRFAAAARLLRARDALRHPAIPRPVTGFGPSAVDALASPGFRRCPSGRHAFRPSALDASYRGRPLRLLCTPCLFGHVPRSVHETHSSCATFEHLGLRMALAAATARQPSRSSSRGRTGSPVGDLRRRPVSSPPSRPACVVDALPHVLSSIHLRAPPAPQHSPRVGVAGRTAVRLRTGRADHLRGAVPYTFVCASAPVARGRGSDVGAARPRAKRAPRFWSRISRSAARVCAATV